MSRADVFVWMKSFLCCLNSEALDSEEGDAKLESGKRFLSEVSAFSSLNDQELWHLSRLTEVRTYPNGKVIVPDERHADGVYVVFSGTAKRLFKTPEGKDNLNIEPELIEYQESFGAPVSPHDSDEVPDTSIVVESEELECLWLPLLVVRMINIQPRMEHEFVVILKNSGEHSDEEYRLQEEIVSNILHAGLHVTVMANTRNTMNHIVLLLSAPLWLLAREDKLMKMERIVEYHSEEDARALGEEYAAQAESMTDADRIQAFANILTRNANDKPPGAGLQGIENNQDKIISDVFPLHDPSFSDFITSSWFQEALSASTRKLFLLRIKDYFGLRVAFYTAFVRLYTAALIQPVFLGSFLWVVLRWVDYQLFVPVLGIYGLAIGCAWAPSFMKRWKRYENALLVEWDLLQTKEVEYPNPEFRDYVVETLNVATEGGVPDYVDVKVYDHRRRWGKFLIYGIFCFICLVLLFVFVGIYVQWYIIAIMTPMCTDPRCPVYFETEQCVLHCQDLLEEGVAYRFFHSVSTGVESCESFCDLTPKKAAYYSCDTPFVGCFETERGILLTGRWLYVLCQGIILGLTLDIAFLAIFEAIASAFNKWENYPTIQEAEKRFVEKIFLFNWVGYFYWFFLLAFLYVPYGDDVQDWLRENIDTNTVLTFDGTWQYSRYWVDGLIAMDSAFVTPLIVTQALNMLINTFVPYLLRKGLLRARDRYLISKDQLSAVAHAAVAHSKYLKRSPKVVEDPTPSTTTTTGAHIGSHLEVQSFETDEDRAAYAQKLSESTPIKAADIESTLDGLLSLTSHDGRMSLICANVSRDGLDMYQRTSYDWIDRVTRDIERKNRHKGIWEGYETGHVHLRLIKDWRCRNYIYNADKIMEESSMGVYNPFGDCLHMAIQFSYVIMFSVVWPFCALCAYCNNSVALRFDAIKMTIDCKRAVPRRTVGIGAWTGAFMFEILVAAMIVPGIFVHVSGQLDSFNGDCPVSEDFYGPVDACFTAAQRLIAFCALENIGIVICFLVYLKKSDISTETSIKIQQHGRKLKHNLRKSVRTIGETILVETSRPNEWKEGTVSWVRNGKLKVNFGGSDQYVLDQEVWLQNDQAYVLKTPTPVKIFEANLPVLIASTKPGRWLRGVITELDTRDHLGRELTFTPNEMHFQIREARNLRSSVIRTVVDPYCVLTCGDFKYTTSIKRHTMNPVWDELVQFSILEQNAKVKLAVYNHHGRLKLGDCLGEATIDLDDFADGKSIKQWIPLTHRRHVLSMENLGNAMQKFKANDTVKEAQIYVELQWIDSRFPTRIHVSVEGHEKLKSKVLSRKFCEKRLCEGIQADEIRHGRLFSDDEHVLAT